MLSNETFVQQSLELNLFFMRIAKEHSFFMEIAFLPNNQDWIQQAESLKIEFTQLLAETICIADGLVRQEVITSGELVTKYTLEAERFSEYYTGINLNKEITASELSLNEKRTTMISPAIVEQIASINQRAISATTALIDYKARLLHDILSCRILTFNYPLLIDHILREARFYLKMLNTVQRRRQANPVKEMVEQEIFWNRIMAEHAYFIRGLLDPTETELFETADKFGKQFDDLTKKAMALLNQTVNISRTSQKTYEATKKLRDFKAAGTEGLLNCKIRSIAIPLLGDHVIREANHYLRLLKIFA